MAHPSDSDNSAVAAGNFIHDIIDSDLAAGKNDGRVHTRFPPEPNGYLHIGHAKSICLNFGTAAKYNGRCNLRFDDTNPSREAMEYVQAIRSDVRWLGFDWQEREFFASDYFDQLYRYAVVLIEKGLAYVCDLSPEEIRAQRGTLTEAGQESPYRNRSVDENRDLFARMRAGEFADGSRVLRAKIDMTAGNINLRDPVIYRIMRTHHHRTGDAWCIYPMYDYAHCVSDALEGITHSLCTLEFEDHRPLYDWFLDVLGLHHPQQIEFARLNLGYTVVSKRKLVRLVQEGHVAGWDDPRMPTLSGMRRRGFPPAAIRDFCDRIGVAKRDSMVDMALLEFSVRDVLNVTAPRRMAVLRPLKVVITNYPEDQVEHLTAANHPAAPEMGSRELPFCRELYIEQEDFLEDAPKKFFRLAPGREVRFRYAYFIRCQEVIKDPSGRIIELRCTYDPETRGGSAPDGRKVKATIHWVSARHAQPAQVRLYDRLFTQPDPTVDEKDGIDFTSHLNPDSLTVLEHCQLEPGLARAEAGAVYQFERLGYFCRDGIDSTAKLPVFNRTVTLRDQWAKMKKGR